MNKQESQTVEFKKTLAERKEILATISAFANTRGGRIYVGVEEDKDGSVRKVVGVKFKGREVENLGNEIKQNTDPVLYPSIEVEEIKGKPVLVVEVGENPVKPVFARIDKTPVAYKRVGKTNQKIGAGELRRILSEGKEFLWDSQACGEATLDDIDEEKVKWFLRKAKSERNFDVEPDTPTGEALEKIGLMRDGGLTNAGVLLFGRKPQKFFLQAETRCARFKGDDVSKPFIDMKVIGGSIQEQIEDAEEFLLSHIKKAVWVEPGKIERTEKWEYPPETIREAIVNAICHRDYESSGNVQVRVFDSRVEIWNPGRLPEGITIELLKKQHISKPRNREIARLLFLIKYIEQWGSGTNKMITACIREGLPEPEFKEIGDDFCVVLTRSRVNELLENPELLNDRQRRVIEHLKTKKTITSGEYKGIFKCSERTARMDLNRIVELGIVKKTGKSKNIRYSLHEAFRQFPAISGNE